MNPKSDNVIPLRRHPGGAADGIALPLENGRFEQVTVGPNAEFNFIKSDPYKTNSYTGIVVPAAPSNSISNARYLFLLARASFTNVENNSRNQGVRLVGIRQYAELVARIPARTSPLATDSGPPTDARKLYAYGPALGGASQYRSCPHPTVRNRKLARGRSGRVKR